MRALFIVVRILGAALIVAAIVGQLVTSYALLAIEAGLTDVSTQIVNFFSFFTIDSNVLTVVVFLIGAVCLIKGESPSRAGSRIGRARASPPTWRRPSSSTTLLLRGHRAAAGLDAAVVERGAARGRADPDGARLAVRARPQSARVEDDLDRS